MHLYSDVMIYRLVWDISGVGPGVVSYHLAQHSGVTTAGVWGSASARGIDRLGSEPNTLSRILLKTFLLISLVVPNRHFNVNLKLNQLEVLVPSHRTHCTQIYPLITFLCTFCYFICVSLFFIEPDSGLNYDFKMYIKTNYTYIALYSPLPLA